MEKEKVQVKEREKEEVWGGVAGGVVLLPTGVVGGG